MFKVILCGKICSELTIKEVGDRKVCNFTLACKNAFDKYESHVRCSIWGSFVDELVKKDYTDKTVLIEGEGTNKLLENNDGNRHYIFNVKCSRIEVV
ncbi:hypothetical protein B5E92_08205 [Erysipelatoclostridium sp. An15]|uniref:single-stranded DNA-binding protein n=1 Tax=unclassified Thomasclavelia TaxID=3025756 RepID=UPI000B39249D|nr:MULTISPECIES: single-stranded DNA-binding protein [unclassified Thomasclavelia]OUP71909.1 hypothetical protein B5F09_13520 [Erysipelatoclostridium sp. An173]OUQ07344.1 hypothetical protein B5E92_08205 [Erysipelatoclostridium sp. An15]